MFPSGRSSGNRDSQNTRIRQRIIEDSLNGSFEKAEQNLVHTNPDVRASAFTALGQAGRLDKRLIRVALSDTHHQVRCALANLGAINQAIPLNSLLTDEDPVVIEITCWAIGERGKTDRETMDALKDIVENHVDSLCRESAVAALGAIGDSYALGSILKANDDIATVRRRAVLALAPFDGPEVELAIKKALIDRDWQVRQAAEDIST
jgi:HEAT repeat protein